MTIPIEELAFYNVPTPERKSGLEAQGLRNKNNLVSLLTETYYKILDVIISKPSSIVNIVSS